MDDVTLRYRTVLKELFKRKGLQKKTLEAKLGWSRGTITKLIQGTYEMKVRQLLLILRAADIDPLDFYAEAHAESEAARGQELEARLMRPFDSSEHHVSLMLPVTVGRVELERLIEEVITKALSRTDKKANG